MRLPLALSLGLIGLETAYLRMAQLGDLRRHAIPFLGSFGVAFLIYLGMVALVRRAVSQATLNPHRWVALGIFLGGLVFRLTLVGVTPALSHDIHRYLWDGQVQQAGINP